MDPSEIAEMERELEELRQENAALTESVNQLEVCVGQLVKEIKFFRHIVTQEGKMAAS